MSMTLSGGRQCGRVRYCVRLEDHEAYLCHCRMCPRATGGVSIAFKSVKQADLNWETPPDWYQSSAIARRPFCSACGTPLGFQYFESENCDLTIGSFDDPSAFHPVTQFGMESRYVAWSDTKNLPGMRCDEYGALVKKWSDADTKMPGGKE